MNQYDFPIDLVYLWCDDTDEVWRAKKQKHLLVENKLDSQSTNDCRFANNDELKYSLRSVAKYAPWINHIYIVSDHQTPNWLNTAHPKITMINHEDILPKENLPLFNASAIETALAKIPNLSEHFLFANDDMFFGNDVKPQDFFTKNGKAIVRLTPNPKKAKIAKSQYSRYIDAMQKLIFNTFTIKFKHQPHHNIDSYLKSEFQNCINHFGELSSATAKQRFRQEPALQRSIIGYWMICKKCGIQKNIKKWKSQLLDIIPPLSNLIKQDSISINISSDKGLQKLWRIKPKMFCLNDCEKATKNNRQNIKQFMEKLFPSKSEFEKHKIKGN